MRLLPTLLLLSLACAPIAYAQPHTPALTRAPELTRFVDAEYPESERAAGAAAVVTLQLTIDETGHVTDATVIEGASEAFDAAAVLAARAFEFSPAEVDGVPAAIRILYRYEFSLQEEAPPPALASLGGVVRERGTGTPLPGVVIEARVPGEDAPRSVTTDDAGHFVLDDLPAG